MEGWLLKRSAVLKKWRPRYCRLIPGDCRLLYYLDEQDVMHNLPKGCIDLSNKEILEIDENEELLPAYTVQIKTIAAKKGRLLLRAETADVHARWLAALEAAINGELPPTAREVTLDKNNRASESIYIPPESIKPMMLDIISEDTDLTFRGVRRQLEQHMGLNEGSLYGVRDTLAKILAQLVQENGLGSPQSFKIGPTSPPRIVRGPAPAERKQSDQLPIHGDGVEQSEEAADDDDI